MKWFLQGYLREPEGLFDSEKHHHHQSSWFKVMCLTGVDYFSTLGYQPGIAVVAAGAIAPLATLILVLLTLFGALPIYRRVAIESPHGEGSISMLEKLLPWWQGKLFVLALLGFVATDFVITITLSAADATAHLVENPLLKSHLAGQNVIVTLILIASLAAVFLKGFNEAIGVAVILVGVYLTANVFVVARGVMEILSHPAYMSGWQDKLAHTHGGNPLALVGVSLLVFPQLALGLSGFETGVAVMPLVKGKPGDTERDPVGRIKNTHRLLATAAIVMSVFLIASSMVCTLMIPRELFNDGGPADGRALAYLCHKFFGEGVGTVYDFSTVSILWFAGASAMAGLLNIVPRYLPRYGMAPEWTRAVRPLVVVFAAIAFAVTIMFHADVKEQGGAYATGVLVLMTSAAIAVTISARHRKAGIVTWLFGFIALVFAYTTVANVLERPDGIRIAGFFILTIIVLSFISRVWRTLELRVDKVEFDVAALHFIRESVDRGRHRICLLPNRPETQDEDEYSRQDYEARRDHHIDEEECVLFVEVFVPDASDFSGNLKVHGVQVGKHQVLKVTGTAVPNAIAALSLRIRDLTGERPHVYFSWGERHPAKYLVKYLFSGRGDTAPLTREILRRVEPDPERRPVVHVA